MLSPRKIVFDTEDIPIAMALEQGNVEVVRKYAQQYSVGVPPLLHHNTDGPSSTAITPLAWAIAHGKGYIFEALDWTTRGVLTEYPKRYNNLTHLFKLKQKPSLTLHVGPATLALVVNEPKLAASILRENTDAFRLYTEVGQPKQIDAYKQTRVVIPHLKFLHKKLGIPPPNKEVVTQFLEAIVMESDKNVGWGTTFLHNLEDAEEVELVDYSILAKHYPQIASEVALTPTVGRKLAAARIQHLRQTSRTK